MAKVYSTKSVNSIPADDTGNIVVTTGGGTSVPTSYSKDYSINVTFDGTSGLGTAGAVTIPSLLIKNGWFIEEFFIEIVTPLTDSTGTSYLTLGFTGNDTIALNSTTGLSTTLNTDVNTKIELSDFIVSNNDANVITLNVNSGNITAGQIKILVRATNYDTAISGDGVISGGGGSGTPLIDVTYSAIKTLITGSLLVPGQQYRITDFNTVHYIVDGNGNQYLTDIITGTVEPLILTAIGINILDKEAKSALFPHDKIYYDLNPANWLQDLSFSDLTTDSNNPVIVPGFKGVIYFRHDTLLDNYMGYDFRNVKFRRWRPVYAIWDNLTQYNKGDFVLNNSIVYRAIKSNNSVKEVVINYNSSVTSGSNTVNVAGIATTLTFNTDLPTSFTDYITTYVTDFAAIGITLGYNGNYLSFKETSVGSNSDFANPINVGTTGDFYNYGFSIITESAGVADPTTNAVWATIADLTALPYILSASSQYNSNTSTDFIDVKTFAEGPNTATYERCCRSNHFESFKDDYIDYD
ncbi:MAG: hypothetical protein ABIP51_17110, partial [Bacteroidia bacterium]